MAKGGTREPVAIIGLGMRLPGANGLDAFWDHLAAERSLISEVSADRWDGEALMGDPAKGNRTNSIWGGFVEDADCFDAGFFGISPREAAWMDPQQRFALEMSWHAIEDAGYRASDLAGSRTGVYMGVCHWDYAELLEKHLAQVDAYTPTGIAFSIIANRVSHFFDFQGPSITNDTACAASMTSIYEAVRALQDGTCDLALAGGVNLIWSPNHFVAFSKAGMLSKDGKGKAFDDAADGYVRGEGGAVLLLKPLSRALADGDPIHAIIRGIGINHGGRTNSLTVTNPLAQAKLITEVHREAGVSPDSIDYVEAHGPGTPLGDPIEISGLKQAFATLAEENGVTFTGESCGIGSVKTNIGHLEGAAGVAGIVKVLAALKHGQLPANVGFRELNRLIDLSGTPFRIQSEATAWPHEQGRSRRACVSSFGFGGSNGHVVLEEPPVQKPVAADGEKSLHVIPLSAVTEARLSEYVAALLRFVEQADGERISLADIARTWQAAREPLEARCAFFVRTLEGLADALRASLIGDGLSGRLFPKGIDEANVPEPAKEMEFASRWIAGEDVHWPTGGKAEGSRIHAPVYPFERERHWMDLSLGAKDQHPVPHPLLHWNTSRFDGCSFTTRLTGDEFVLYDHHVGDSQVLPGVACLEMARAAVDVAGGLQSPSFAIEDVVWSKPIRIADRRAVTVETALERREPDRIRFSIRTAEEPGDRVSNVPNAQGTLLPLTEAPATSVNLDELKAHMSGRVEPQTCYDRLRTSGVDHGPSFRALAQVHRGTSEALAQLKLPRRLLASLDAMPLHPVLLDAAIQAWVAIGDDTPSGAAVPFSCRRIEVFGACEPVMWVHVRLTSGAAPDAPMRHLDIDLYDKTGVKKAAFHDLALRVLKPGVEVTAEVTGDAADPSLSMVVTDGNWQEAPLQLRTGGATGQTRILLAGATAETAAVIGERTGWGVDRLPDVAESGIAEAAETLFIAAHRIVADILRARPAEPIRILILATDAVPVPAVAPLAGLLKTAAIENPKIGGRVITLAGECSPDRLSSIALAEARASDTLVELRYSAAGMRQAWMPVSETSLEEPEPFSIDPDGVYWITGGLGGLGLIFADWLVARGARKLVLTGRREKPDRDGQARLEALREQGADVAYFACDIAKPEEVEDVAARIAREQGALKGIIHTAGILDDGYILTQEVAKAAGVFAPKVAGTVNLDRATQDQPLDFFVLCSSIASVFGNAGQAAYAAANAFMDAFAETRSANVASGARKGKTIAVAWPLWSEGGMSVDMATLEAMKRRLGLTPLPTEAGLAALETVLSGNGSPRSTVLHGDLERIDAVLAGFGESPDVEPVDVAPEQTADTPVAAGIDDATLKRKTVDYVRDILADVLEMDAARIRANRKLEEYGLDSIAIVESTNRLEEALGPLSKTLFFEYVDLEGVADHLVAEHKPALQSLFAEDEVAVKAEAAPPPPAQKTAAMEARPAGVVSSAPVQEEESQRPAEPARDDRHDIAIVGLSLHVSKADDQDAFWKMLSEGIDGFEPVPSERWDNSALHHGERDVLGKTVVKTGAFLKDIDKFDPRYFRISQAEAELMSPEVRLFLQASVEAFEDAGYSRETMARRTGGDVAVIVGSMTNEYDLYGFQNMLMRGSLASGSYTGTVPNMVSYYYGFTGPSYFLDTMCSAASTCVHEAVHMLRAGRCRMALAGGVSLLLHPQKLIATSQEHFTTKSADVIRGYGLGAEGTILGEGVGALVLKPLADAERDGDHIYGVITGSGISNAGVRNGFTVPNPNQQAVAIERALDDAGISPKTIGYIEGHGSGTALGDPIEVKALTQVFRKHTDAVQTCPIGTVKSNVAHLLGASGLAGIVKVLAQLKHGQLAPSLHAETLNPDIPFAASPFYVQRELSPWTRLKDEAGRELPRRAGVTSIGAGGMNSHIIIEEYRTPVRPAARQEPDLLVFSALTADRLRTVLQRFKTYLQGHPDNRLADIAYTLQSGRNELTCRLALIARDRAEALAAIDTFLASGECAPGMVPGMVYVPSILDCDPPEDRDALIADCAARRLEAVASAWCAGASVDWDVLNEGRDVRRVSLPAYPFERIRCWCQEEPDAPSVVNPIGARSKLHPFIGLNRSDVTGLRYTTAIHLKELRDYVYTDGGRDTVLPTVAAEIAAAAARIAGMAEHPFVRELQITASPNWSEVRDLEIAVEPGAAGGTVRVETVTQTDQRLPWLRATVTETAGRAERHKDIAALRRAATEVLDSKAVYDALKARRLAFGPYLEGIDQAWRLADGGVLCRLRKEPPQQDFFKKNIFCPAPALGAAFEALLLAAPDLADHTIHAIDSAELAGADISDVLCLPEADGRFSVQFLDSNGRIMADMSGIAYGGQAVARAVETRSETPPSDNPVLLLQRDLREKAVAILKFAASDLGAREAFHDLGFDSISLTRYANDISAAYGIDLSPAIFFECEHIEALAEHLVKRHGVVPQTAKTDTAPAQAIPAQAAADVVSSPPLPDPVTAPAPKRSGGPADDRIAIIGMAGRFPQSPDVESFFDNLLAGRDLTSDLPLERYSLAYAERLCKAGFTGHGGFLEDVDRFDAAFFKVSPVEAERMDPQQRLLLETAWRALEDAGYTPEDLPRRTGVFVGITSLDYADLWHAEGLAADGYVATGNSLAMAANRLSHQFNLSGPSQAIDTACSSSLVALLRARDALRAGQCSAALVGGVNLCLSLEGFEGPHQAGMLSPTGHCHTFGSAADGYARGEGVAVLLLKRLADAERDGDRILGVIAGGAENHGGRSGALTAPNAKAQAQLIVEAMDGIDPHTVSFIEAHGTGTELGDPVEINGLRRAYAALTGTERASAPPVGLGTVKSSIGHLEAAAGLAGVIKILMAMRRNELPPTLNSTPLNPHIDLDGSPFRIVTEREPWPAGNATAPRRAGVSSFGFGGTNAHVVLESYDAPSSGSRQPLAPHSFAPTRFWLPTVKPAQTERDRMLFAADWVPAEASGQPYVGRRLAVGCGVQIGQGHGAEVVHLAPVGRGIGEAYADAARQLLELLQREMASPAHDDLLIQLAVPADGDGTLYAGLFGMLMTAAQEEPRIKIQMLEVPSASTAEMVAEWLLAEAGAPGGTHSRYQNGRRTIRTWRELPHSAPQHRWRDGGAYLIAGGMGGLGRLVAEDIARTAKGAVLVLTGSKPIDDDRQDVLKSLRELGAVTAYRQVDMADAAAVKALVGHIVEVHGGLSSVIHCVGTLRDGFLAGKSNEDLQAVLAPKVAGAIALHDACAGLDLDAFVLFSSLAGPFGNAGQADYAAANGFLDALARSSGGAIKSIDWPLWQEGGMRVDEATEQALFRRMGQRPLQTAAGLEALHLCLGAGASQVAVVAGEQTRIRNFFAAGQADTAAKPQIQPPAVETTNATVPSAALTAKTRSKLSGLFARISGLAAEAIDPQALLEDYGIDSLMITRLNNELGDIFRDLPKTLFFRHRTLAAVSDYLVETQPLACAEWAGVSETAAAPGEQKPAQTSTYNAVVQRSQHPAQDEPIAIIGISGTYPDAPDLDAFWENLLAGHDAVREIPEDRWSLDGFFESDPDEAVAQGKSYSKWGAFLDGFADFDPLFFKLSPRDAAAMDPQERLFLTSAWQALEDAGYTRDRLKASAGTEHGGARVGVFAGVTKTGYALYGPFTSEGGARVRPSTSFAGMANRVSHILDLSGPSLPVDTMCSSSLTAIHEACEHLRAGSCAMAIAGGVNLYLHPANYAELSAAHMLSPSGQCRSFGEGADGFVPGEGVGCVLLKPLSRALADGDRIHALIKGSAVNHGGRTNGYTVPSPAAQRDVVRAALDHAGLSARDLGSIEAHGTGTDLGDPIEVDGLTQAFAADTTDTGFCALGSVKSSIGHLEAAAGIAGLTKAVLQMQHRTLVPSLHAERTNPNIDLAKSPFTLQRDAAPWVSDEPRRAGISSFGAGGANAHVIVEEWTEPQSADRSGATGTGPQAIILSARDGDRLMEAAERFLAYLRKADTAKQPDTAPDLAAVISDLCMKLGSLLDVDPCDIDPEESFDALGLDASHASAMTRWIASSFSASLNLSDVELAGSVKGLASILCANGGQGAKPTNALDLADIAYTLQVGREAMDCRLGILARDIGELAEILEAWIAGSDRDLPVFVSHPHGKRGVLSSLSDDEVIAEVVARAWETDRLETVLRLWVEGVDIAWSALPQKQPAQIVSLPTYPFERNRYWIPAEIRGGLLGVDESTGLRQAVETPAGDAALLAEQETLEMAVARVLRVVLNEIPETDVMSTFWPWLEAAKALLDTQGRDNAASSEDAWAAWQAQKQSGQSLAQMELAETALRALPEILTGRRRATDVLFPDGRQTLVEAVYKENAVAARFSRTVADVVAQVVADRTPTQGKLRILEIGAGTGGTSESVFEALRTHADRIGEYAYTDVSRAFLIHAQRAYADKVPGLTTALFDVEKPLEDQQIAPGRYDLVIAANVLHATADIGRTLARVRETMAPGGVLLMNETSKPTLFTHVTFGLLEGWWRFTDPERRIPGTPSLTPNSWRTALAQTGFSWIAGSSKPELSLGQQIIAARAEGPAATEAASPMTAAVKAAANDVGPTVAATPVRASSENPLRAILLAALAETLNVAPSAIDVEKSFADYGLDSILGAELVHRLRKALGIDLDQTALFDFTNVLRLESYLTKEFPQAVATVQITPVEQSAAPANIAPAPVSQPQPSRKGDSHEPIAIVGASGRFAKSDTIDELWAHLAAGDDLVEPVSRFDLAPFYEGAEPGSYGRHGSFLDGIDRFDPVFFGISGLEATYMDPQQRLFLEEAWKTLENAGHAGDDMIGRRCGVFVGCAHGDYQELFIEQPPGQAFWGNTTSLIPARISYWLDLKGPAVAVDTACSSSLVALHLACQAIRNGECEMALAGGVFVQCSPRFFRYANAAQMLSPSGHCAAFGAGADGIVPGEAVGAVLLRPLSDALADGDTVLGVIAASGTNQDGTTNGITAPSAASQERLIRQVYDDYGIDPASIDFVEAHGTGTVLGDPIEHAALVRAYADAELNGHEIFLGSVKSNIGHATTAAGIAGLAKVLWSLNHETIPPTLHFAGGNPAIDFAKGPFRVNDAPVAWPVRPGGKRRAAISSFGFSGTNAHVVIEEAPETAAVREPASSQLFVLSARTPEQLRTQAEHLVSQLEADPDLLPEDVAFTLIAGRRAFAHRLVLVAGDLSELVTRLKAWLAGATESCVETGEAGPSGEEAGRQVSGSVSVADEGQRADQLRALGRAFLTGGHLDVRDMFCEPRRRVPLPTYPFAAKSYWVKATKPVVDQRPEPKLEAAAPVAPQEGQPAPRVRLAAPAAMAASATSADVVRSPKVTLPSIGKAGAPAEPEGEVTRGTDRDGVRRLNLTGAWGKPLASRLTEELEAASRDETVRAVVLTGDTTWKGNGRTVGGFDPEAVLNCAVPVIASVRATASEQAAAIALLSDFLVMADTARLEDVPAPASKLAACLRDRRLGKDRDGILRVPVGQEDEAALRLAGEIANGPREALALLKAHMRCELPLLLTDLPQTELQLDFAGGPQPGFAGSSRKIPLKTDVMDLELFDDGVVLLRMTERDGRNMFTPAFMDGLEEAFAKVAELTQAKVVVLTGHDTWFACGGTADGLADLQQGGSRFTDRRIYSLPLECELPVIAAMQGHGIGAGWSLGMYCDRAVFAAEGIYHSNYLWYGFTPGAGATLIFPHRLGDDLGREVLFTAREYRGRELGERSARVLVKPGREVLGTALTAAHALAGKPRAELLAMKAEMAAPLRALLDAVLERELAMHEKTFIGNDSVRARIAEKFGEADRATETTEASKPSSIDATALRTDIVSSLAEDLMIDVADIRDGDSFLDLGLDSILAVTWIRKLNTSYGIDLPATAVYAHPTVGALIAHVAELVGEQPVTEAAAPATLQSPPVQATPSPTETATGDHRRKLRTEIVSSLAEDLMIETSEIADSSGFLDLGLDSILAVTWVRKLNTRYGIDLPATAVYAHPTVGGLVDHVATLVPVEVSQVVEPEPVPVEADQSPAAIPASVPAQPSVDRHTSTDAIAIIGASGKFPKARNLGEFWENIRSGRDCIDEVPPSRWDIDRYYDPDPQAPGKSYCKWMGALDGAGEFDARFFNITPLEAELMDPQQRLFLETAWHAIEDAAIDPASLAGSRCGVYVSSGPSGYEDLISERNTYSLLGSSGSILAARISYLLDLRGPCLSIDTACSSSLVALAEACESLVSGTCDMALAGGACVLVGPNMFIDTAKVSMLSADGRCFSFDERANGFVPGEGVGAVLLKRLADAERDGDPIHAVIRGWGINQDGRTNGITAPNPKAQTALLKDVYERFEIDPATVGLIECHGTGTPLGDPIEVEGLTDAFEGVPAGDRCAIGSVKSNIGHLLASAGIAGVLKVMLALEHRQVPPSINVETLNSHIPFERTPFAVSRSLCDWDGPSGTPRRAGVSAFGFSGTNAHAVLEEYVPDAVATDGGTPKIFVLSARNRDRLIAYAGDMERFITARPDLDLTALVHTLQTGRSQFGERLAFAFTGRDDLLRKLSSVVAGRPLEGVYLSAGDADAVALFGSDDDARALVAKWLRSGEANGLNKVSELWAKGLAVDWPAMSAARLHLPGYPFERTSYWVEPAEEVQPSGTSETRPVAGSLLGTPPQEGEIGQVAVRINGDEPFLTTHTSGTERLMAGLFLPEIARNALERLSGEPVRSLQHLLWGRPVPVNGKPRDLTVIGMSDSEGLLYQVEADGDEGRPWHLGTVAAEPDGLRERKSLDETGSLPGADITPVFRDFAERCAIYSGPPSAEMATVSEVRRDGDALLARLVLPRGSAEDRQGLLFDPFVLDAVWRLLTFRAGGWVADAGAGNALAFPLSMERMTGFSSLEDKAIVRIDGGSDSVGLTVELYGADGRECLHLEGVRLTRLEQSRDIRIGEEVQP
ncbi:SDR family NAD(P)-dependent oxidoreductase [Roseibium aggregatum]|uniref:SDR family NAD(P)-dependent oxidoreductase n=1 Tax=Roseibium aggregatum TaxID=187304 RepID=A0A926NNY5_9HYPH|nr:SDR family NAD(P)-dependent oxidoreductase [Roseibium aggregatum]MBD1544677.1 SDR family NAD(P)-dependent oxidoreductase [Roseibium aggregatum]